MYSTRLVQVLMVVLSILIATRASWFHHHDARQGVSVSLMDDTLSDADETTPTPTPTPTEEPESSDSETSTSSTPEPTPTSDEPTTSDTPTSRSTSSTSSTSSSSTTSDNGPITTPPTSRPTSASSTSTTSSSSETPDDGGDDDNDTKSSSVEPVTSTKTIIYTTTNDMGSTFVGSSESVVVTTPGISGGNGSGDKNEGLTQMQRDTIIGVTVGVGGAIILAAAGILYWRLRNKRRSQEENEELISYGAGFGGPGTAEKTETSAPSAGARSPFQSTLETYHAPTQTNAASNF